MTANPYDPLLNKDEEEIKTGGSSRLRDRFSTVLVFLAAPLMALIMIHFVFQTYEVEGPSMERTLQDKDRLIVWKVNRTWARLTGNDYIPERYDVIVFNHRGIAGSTDGSERQLIKRVIGLPGDRVVVKDGAVTIYNKEKPGGFQVDDLGPEKDVITITAGNIDETIQPGQIFVMGDNRENSLDSRNLGPIRAEDIVGKLSMRIYPFDKADKF